MLIEPKIVLPKEYYKNYLGYSRNHLLKGVELWNSNIIKIDIIPRFEIDKINLYKFNKKTVDDWNDTDFELAEFTHRKFEDVLKYVGDQYHFNLSIPNLLMAIAVESILKGFLLHSGYIIHIHKRKNKLIKVNDVKNYSKLEDKVYSLNEFAKKFNVLKAALPWESDENRLITRRDLEHLKKLRDMEAHLAIRNKMFVIYDLLLFKTVDDLMNKATVLLHSNFADKEYGDTDNIFTVSPGACYKLDSI